LGAFVSVRILNFSSPLERFIVLKRLVDAEIDWIEDDAVERVHVIKLRYGLPCVLRPREPFIETTLKIG